MQSTTLLCSAHFSKTAVWDLLINLKATQNYNSFMLVLMTAFAVSLIVTLLIVRSAKVHAHLSMDHDVSGPQKFHASPVPRVGGVGIFLGLIAATVLFSLIKPEYAKSAAWLLLCGSPAFVVGLVEDLTKRVSPGMRLLAVGCSALLSVWLMGAALTNRCSWA